MRINEFASAEDALTMWKVISDNTWAAIAQQAEAEAKQKAERAAARKSASKRGTGKSTAKPMPPKRLPPPLQHVSAPVAKDSKSTAAASTATSAKSADSKQQSTVQNPSQPLPSALQPQQQVQPITVGAVASQAIPNQANLARQTQFARSTKK
jgi:hypothetical protein